MTTAPASLIKTFCALQCLVIVFGRFDPAFCIAQITESKILPDEGNAGDKFGASVSISGDYAIMGAHGDDTNTGSAYIFRRDPSGWVEHAKLTASDRNSSDMFGFSVSIDGSFALVGAPSSGGFGAAYLFERKGDIWTEIVKLVGSDVGPDGDFGSAVSIFGGYLIVGAEDDDENGNGSGAAYIFQNQGAVVELAKLTASDGESNDHFGWSVSISGEYAIVGSPEKDIVFGNEGSAYVYRREGSNWEEEVVLTERNPSSNGRFGGAVAISNNRAVVGAIFSNQVHIFLNDTSGWTTEDRIRPEGLFFGFGHSVDIEDDFVLVGAEFDDRNGNAAGSAYLFRRFGQSWIEETILVASDGAPFSYFGNAVAMSSEHILIGSYLDDDNGSGSGSAYVYGGFHPIEPISARITSSDSPITIPPEGGSFEYTMHFVNNTTIPQNTDIWIITERPGPPPVIAFGPREKTFGSAASVSKGRSLAVPGNAPAGDYIFILYVGTYPDSIMDSDTLSFTKLAAGSPEQVEPSEHGSFLAVQSYPNPFNPSTTLQFSLPQTSYVSLKIFNTLGENVATLISDDLSAGTHRVEWNASQNASGVYFYILQASGLETITGKLLLLK